MTFAELAVIYGVSRRMSRISSTAGRGVTCLERKPSDFAATSGDRVRPELPRRFVWCRICAAEVL